MGHKGIQKTLQSLRASFFTSHNSRLVREFMKGCFVYQHNKIEHLHPTGLLQSLDMSHTVWSEIAMDFME